MLKAQWAPYRLDFRFEARTSRETMLHKDTYYIRVFDTDNPDVCRYGECALFRGLSADDVPHYEESLSEACTDPLAALQSPCSSIRFGFETALIPLLENDWTLGHTGIPINGLIWMGDKETMRRRIAEKLDGGFRVLKLKIGGIDFEDEVELLRMVRQSFSPAELEIRLDANGSFSPKNAVERLKTLSAFGIHSIEQPIRAGQTDAMAKLCIRTPIPIALDEELIGLRTPEESEALLDAIAPQYIILKPSLCGGFEAADVYISLAGKKDIGWWATSALESDIGLEAIGRWVSQYSPEIPQGLGTGQLYDNNIESPLRMKNGSLYYDPEGVHGKLDSLQWRQ